MEMVRSQKHESEYVICVVVGNPLPTKERYPHRQMNAVTRVSDARLICYHNQFLALSISPFIHEALDFGRAVLTIL